jgi:hypothetical protein
MQNRKENYRYVRGKCHPQKNTRNAPESSPHTQTTTVGKTPYISSHLIIIKYNLNNKEVNAK